MKAGDVIDLNQRMKIKMETVTKSELQEQLQGICNRLNDLHPVQALSVYDPGNGNLILRSAGWVALTFPYIPDPVIPTKFKLVLYQSAKGVSVGISTGEAYSFSELKIRQWDEGFGCTKRWYCPETGESNDWDNSWTPEFFSRQGLGCQDD